MTLASHRVRWRLTLASTAVLTIVLAVFCVAVYVVVERTFVEQGRAQLQTNLRRIDALVKDELGDGAEVGELAKELLEEGDVPFHAVRVPGHEPLATERWKRAPELAPVLGDPGERVVTLSTGETLRVSARHEHVAGQDVVIAAAADVTELARSLSTFTGIMLGAFPLAILVALAGGWWLAGRLLAPVEDAFTRLRRFTADASHELRTPLTAMRMVGEVALLDPGDTNRGREAIASMLEEIDRLATLVDRLLTLTRADAAAYQARFEAIDLAALARDVAEALQPIAEERGLELAVAAAGAVPVRADVATLKQAVSNLVDNALRYTPRGGCITITCERRANACVLAVVDTGPGIAREDHVRVFERFVRLDSSRSNADHGALTRGYGLGLAIAKWAIELNGGRIELESAAGRGSTFRVTLPFAAWLGSPDHPRAGT